jgi:hypothetical protein
MSHRFATGFFLELAVPRYKIANSNRYCRYLTAVARKHLLHRRRVGEATARKRLRIPPTSRLRFLARLPNLCLVLFTKHNTQRASILRHAIGRSRARNGEEVVPLRKNPREGQLARSAIAPLCNLRYAVDEFQVLWEILSREPGRVATRIRRIKVIGTADLASEHAAADRRVGYDRYAELAGGFEEANLRGLDVEAEGRVSESAC